MNAKGTEKLAGCGSLSNHVLLAGPLIGVEVEKERQPFHLRNLVSLQNIHPVVVIKKSL